MPTTTDGADAPDLAGRAMTRSSSSSSPPPAACRLQITTAATTAANNSANPSSPVAQSSSSSSRVAGAAAGSGQNQACAACKYQRRKCNPDCPLAPYFPADQQRRFLNAHRLFGVGHIQATLRETPPDLHTDAMRALIFQAEARAYDPVGGCCRIILDYERQLGHAQAELAALLRHLDLCRHQAAAAAIAQDALVNDPGMLLLAPGPNPADVQDGVAALDALYAGHEISNGQANHHDHDPQKHQPYEYFYYDGPAAVDETSSHAWGNAGNVQQQYGDGVKAESPVALDDQIETQFVDAFDVKPEIAASASVAVMEPDDGGSGASFDHRHLEQKVVATVVKNERLDHQAAAHMAAESSSRCQLELGFSSF
ncbi:uncharacterized protein [Triticum aestivum]|uniref:uncharacterized protein isoform X2 n=1 Tax=Triticum aestivum TaxID=4565 RepID=UPI001D030CCB|nr:uncharacterized protein LOC123116101 isoform X2 [Triticum aestivum]